MHEVGLAQSVIDIVEKTARDNGATKVTAVTLSVGEIANVDMESFMQAIRIGMRGTVMDAAHIQVTRPEGTGWCMACGKTVPVHRIGVACPVCGTHQVTVTGGTDIRVADIEIED